LSHKINPSRSLVLLFAIVLSLVLSSCTKTSSAPKLFVPSFCDRTSILAALPTSLAGAKWIDTQWEPAKGTDLDAALSEGGLACTFGLQEAEIGTTILWSPDDEFLFSERSVQWKKDGQSKVDLPDLDESAAFARTEGTKGTGEYHVWAINLLYEGFWIQVNATFTDSVEKMMPIIKAAIASLRNEETMKSENISGCYAATVDGDVLTMKLDQQDRNIVVADMFFGYSKKDSSEGKMFGSYTNGVLNGIYQVQLLDGIAKSELFFKGDKAGFKAANGPTEKVEGELKFKRPLQLSWDTSYQYTKSEKCQPLTSQ
jgi:hypothetical protein